MHTVLTKANSYVHPSTLVYNLNTVLDFSTLFYPVVKPLYVIYVSRWCARYETLKIYCYVIVPLTKTTKKQNTIRFTYMCYVLKH